MDFCCRDMQAHVRIVTEHTAQLCDGEAISYLPQFHEYGIPCGDGHSHIVIHYCPIRCLTRRSPRHTRLTAGGENIFEIWMDDRNAIF